jgi:predicted CxxxxCH...CXXCH cytochrome family protein
MRSSAARSLVSASAVALAGGLGLLWSCSTPEPSSAPVNQCATCHGAPSRAGTALDQAAPPGDLLGRTDPSAPGVGAHQNHLQASETHAAVPCTECHVVPPETNSPGHADSAGPAEFVPGPLARHDGRSPSYDAATYTCSSAYCHLDSEPNWTAPRSSAEACDSCHGAPPPSPHPENESCEHCHGAVMASADQFLAPERHVDGTVDLPEDCEGCHGTAASYAPPPDLSGSTAVSSIGVGAHQAHLTGGDFSRPVECSACHLVPEKVTSKGHLDETPHAELTFAGLATAEGRHPSWDRDALTCARTYCHGPVSASAPPSPEWTSEPTGALACDSCHGMPPATPHPQADECSVCHSEVVSGEPGNLSIIAPWLHVNGIVEVF